jgi:hypothetical protein
MWVIDGVKQMANYLYYKTNERDVQLLKSDFLLSWEAINFDGRGCLMLIFIIK